MNKLGDHIPIKGIVDAKTNQEFKTYYIIYFNLVGSSRPNISLEQQIRKLNDFNDMIYQTINATVFYDNSHIFFLITTPQLVMEQYSALLIYRPI